MKYAKQVITLLVLVVLLTFCLVSSAQEASPSSGFTITVGDWILYITEVTDDQDAILEDQIKADMLAPRGTSRGVFYPNEGFDLVRIKIDVPPECKKENGDDLVIALVEKNGEESSIPLKITSSSGGLINKFEYMFLVHEYQSRDEITLRVTVKDQSDYTCTLSALMAPADDI